MAARHRSVRLDEELWEELQKRANAQERSVNWILTKILKPYFAKEAKQPKKGGK